MVEDDRDACELLAGALSGSGAEVYTAANVDEALAIAQGSALDVLISDIAMPGRDGYDLRMAFRALSPAHRRIPSIAVTALASHEDRTNVLAAGFQQHVPKPVDPDELVAIVAATVRPAA